VAVFFGGRNITGFPLLFFTSFFCLSNVGKMQPSTSELRHLNPNPSTANDKKVGKLKNHHHLHHHGC
jgi:hypothetical protein